MTHSSILRTKYSTGVMNYAHEIRFFNKNSTEVFVVNWSMKPQSMRFQRNFMLKLKLLRVDQQMMMIDLQCDTDLRNGRVYFGTFKFTLSWTLLFFFFLWRYSPNLGLGLPPWNSPFHFGFPDLRHSVGLLGRVISSSQGLYLYTNTGKSTYTYKHLTSVPWVGFEPTSERRQCMPQTARLPWPAKLYLPADKYKCFLIMYGE
jgi:hypothetical protein